MKTILAVLLSYFLTSISQAHPHPSFWDTEDFKSIQVMLIMGPRQGTQYRAYLVDKRDTGGQTLHMDSTSSGSQGSILNWHRVLPAFPHPELKIKSFCCDYKNIRWSNGSQLIFERDDFICVVEIGEKTLPVCKKRK